MLQYLHSKSLLPRGEDAQSQEILHRFIGSGRQTAWDGGRAHAALTMDQPVILQEPKRLSCNKNDVEDPLPYKDRTSKYVDKREEQTNNIRGAELQVSPLHAELMIKLNIHSSYTKISFLLASYNASTLAYRNSYSSSLLSLYRSSI